MEKKSKVLEAKNLKKIYKGKIVVKDVSITLKQGQIIGLLGPNGAGKTTSFYMIVGLIKPNGGEIFINGENVSKYPIYKRAQMGITYLPQEKSIFRNLTVWDNIMAIVEYNEPKKSKRKERVEKLLEEFSISHLVKNKGSQLSGGETRRVEIARALATTPKFILLDEPFTGVDPKSIEELQKLVLALSKRDIGILITDHNVRETLKITDFSYIIYEGQILKSGNKNDLINDPLVRKIYLGENFTN